MQVLLAYKDELSKLVKGEHDDKVLASCSIERTPRGFHHKIAKLNFSMTLPEAPQELGA